MFSGKLAKMGKGEMGKGEMGNHKDIEEKFKKETSKEIANLKEFLIQQGKEIVKIKQENKTLKDKVESRQNLKNDGSGGMSPEVRGILEKHQLALEKQKENTTKLSKLCLGTLNELEKFEKHTERENSVQSKRDSVIRDSLPRTEPKVEEKLKRLTDENKKLIQLVTTLDQHVNTLEDKLANSNALDQHVQKPGKSEVSKEEVSRLVKENLEQAKQDNLEKDAQIQSLVTEVQNIIGQVRDIGTQNKEVQDKVRRIELNDGTERLGLEFAKTISRLEKVEREAGGGAQKAQEIGTFADDVAKRIDVLENDLRRSKMGADDIKRVVDKIEKESTFSAESSSKRIDTCERQLEKFEKETRVTSNESIQKMRGIEQEVRTLEESLKKKLEETKLASVTSNDSIRKMGSIEQEVRTLEESLKRKIDESKTASLAATDTTNKKLTNLEKDINNVSAEGNRCKSMVDQLTTKLNKLENNSQLKEDVAPLSLAQEKMEECLSSTQNTIKQCEKHVENLTGELEKYKNSIDYEMQHNIQLVRNELGNQVSKAEQNINNKLDSIAPQILELSSEKKRSETNTRENDQIIKELNILSSSQIKLEKKLEGTDGIKRDMDKFNQSIATISRNQDDMRENVQNLGISTKDYRTKTAEIISNLKLDLNEKISENEKEFHSAERQILDTQTSQKSELTNILRVIDLIQKDINITKKDEEAARDSRRQQNTLSMEDVKKDFNKLQDQLTYLEEKVLALQKQVDGSTIEGKNTKENITGEIGLLADKVKNLSVVIKDDKFKNEEKLVKLEKQVQDINQDTTKIEKNITTLTGTQSKLEKSLSSVDDASRSCKSDVETLKSDLNNVRVISNKNIKEIEEHSGKLFDCIHDFENLKEDLEKLNKKIDKRPAVEEMDKKSELSNQLFNTLSTRIDDVESSVAKESKKTKTELDKINKDIKNVSSKQEENNSQLSKDVTTLKNEMTALKGTAGDVKSIIKDITTLKTDNEKSSKDIKNANDKSDETKVQLSSLQSEVKSLLSVIEKVKSIEKEIGVSKKENSSDKLTSIEKECSSLRADHEKMNKDMKSISTDLKYVDSLLKKEVANTKTELSSFGKTLKSNDKDILSLQGMVEVLNNSLKDESSSDANLEKITNLQNEIRKFSDSIKGCERKIDENKDVIQKKVMNDVKDIEEKIKKVKDELTLKLSTCNSEISNLGGKIDTNSKETKQLADTKEIDKKIKTAKEDLEEKIKKSKEEVVSKVTSCTSDIKGLEKKMDTMIKEGKSQSDTKDLDSKIKVVKDDLISKLTSLDNKITTVKEDIGPKVLNISTETKALDKKVTEIDKKSTQLQKDNESKKTTEILNKSSDDTKDIKKDIDKINQQIKENMAKYDSKVAEVKSSVKEVNDKLEKSTDDTKNIKKDIDKINQQIKENMLKCDGKVTEVKSSVKEVNDKLVKLEKSQTEPKSKTAPKDNSAEVKKDMDKINQLIKDNLKSCQDKGVQQEAQLREVKTSIKDVNDQLAKIEKDGRATPKPGAGAESAKLMTLTKAIDSIQDNTKSLETMVTKMKSEFTTSKDLEKLRTELKGGGLGDLGNHPDMGPIMDSLIMTNDRPFVDCATVTPMTGNGLVKFERFNAMNKLPWDDVGDQFVIQEPGVYCVNVTAILQDAGLSIKLASPVLEREVASLGSRDGLLGSSCPAFISRSALFQIDDDENCVETVLVEIHADNEDSFIDKNVTLTMFKIAEGSGQNDE